IEAVLQRVDARLDRVIRFLAPEDAMYRNGHTGSVRLIDCGLDLLQREVIGVVVTDELDDLGSLVNIDPDRLANLRRTVRIDILVLPKITLGGRDVAGLPAPRSDDLAGIDDRGADEPSPIDRSTHVDHCVFRAVAHVAYRGESAMHENFAV